MNLFYSNYKLKLFSFGLCLLLSLNISNTFSQKLDFKEIISLKYEKTETVNKYLNYNKWIKDSININTWYLNNNYDNADITFKILDEGTKSGVFYLIVKDSSIYKKIKSTSLKKALDTRFTRYPGIIAEDHSLENIFLRFCQSKEVNYPAFYAIWIFSKYDEAYFNQLDSLNFSKYIEKEDTAIRVITKNGFLSINSNIQKNEINPDFIGGEAGMQEFLHNNIKYPAFARENGINGTVYASFIVEADGSITNIKILKGIGGGCDWEVKRLLNIMPKWKPGTRDGKAIRVQFNMPVNFTIQEF